MKMKGVDNEIKIRNERLPRPYTSHDVSNQAPAQIDKRV